MSVTYELAKDVEGNNDNGQIDKSKENEISVGEVGEALEGEYSLVDGIRRGSRRGRVEHGGDSVGAAEETMPFYFVPLIERSPNT
jgi:hypothetical protein